MAYGRWALEQGYDLSVRELALLGQMTEAATRNSLSKERIVLEKGKVDANTALIWLSQRRDFAPTRIEKGHKERWPVTYRPLFERQGFGMAFATILRGYLITAAELADKAEVALSFVEELVAGRLTPDLDALQRVGLALHLDAAHFAGAAVQAALHRKR